MMSRFFSSKHKNLVPYTPGEQPREREYIKLNTNESPFPPSKKAQKESIKALKRLNLYPDPQCSILTQAVADNLGVKKEQVLMTNGSDEILNFVFMAFCDEKTEAVFPDISYGFYKVFAQVNSVPYSEIPLKDDFTINADDYVGIGKNIFIANPNAPTGISLSLADIEKIVSSNKDNIVVIDEAYVDFGGESAIGLIDKYDNLIVTRTFSKSRSMAGARLGFGVASEEIIKDLNTIKYSTNPYNINSTTMAAGIGCMSDEKYTLKNCQCIQEVRDYTVNELDRLGFTLTDSITNFVFAKHDKFDGKKLYEKLKENSILVRHFDKERISQYLRITIGTKKQMTTLVKTLKKILEDEKSENK